MKVKKVSMKEELHRKLYQAQERWFAMREQGQTKHEIKMRGLRDHGDMHYYMRPILFTGATRVAYERELKRFVDYAKEELGRERNQDITKKDFRKRAGAPGSGPLPVDVLTW